MRKVIVGMIVALAALLSACGASQSADIQAASSGPVTKQQIAALAEQVFPKVEKYGYYGVCGVDGNVSGCPFTDRLKARLTQLRQTIAGLQNPSETREITAEIMSPDAGIAHVKLFRGRLALDLWVVRRGQTLLVDDQICAGRKDSSIYATLPRCEPPNG